MTPNFEIQSVDVRSAEDNHLEGLSDQSSDEEERLIPEELKIPIPTTVIEHEFTRNYSFWRRQLASLRKRRSRVQEQRARNMKRFTEQKLQ